MFISLPSHLSENFAAGKKYIIATGSQVFLATANAQFFGPDGKPAALYAPVIVNLESLWEKFIQSIGDKTIFTSADLQQIAAIDAKTLRLWEAAGVVTSVGGSYGHLDAFAVALTAALCRNGASVPAAQIAGRFCRSGQGAEVGR